jgi:hypothetical protein
MVALAMSVAGTVLGIHVATPRLAEAQMAQMRVEALLTVTDNGADRIRLIAGEGHYGTMRILDVDGQMRVHLETTEGRAGSVGQGLAIWNGQVPVARLGSVGGSQELQPPPRGAGNLLLRDESGKDRIRLLVLDDGTPVLELIGNTETLVWSPS